MIPPTKASVVVPTKGRINAGVSFSVSAILCLETMMINATAEITMAVVPIHHIT